MFSQMNHKMERRQARTTQTQDGRARRHLALDGNGHMEDELLYPLGRSSLDDRALVPLAAGGEVAEGADGVALDLLVLVVREQVDQGREEARLDDRRLVVRVDRDVAHACGRREDEGKEGGAEEAEERREATVAHDFKLVLVCASRD